jgi:hypothetical protein
MSRKIGPTVEILMRRVRQEGGLAINPDFATKIYTYCEQLTNIKLRKVISSTSLTTPKEKLLFNYRDEIPDAANIVSVLESNRELFLCKTLGDLSAFEPTWFRNITGTRFEAWHQIGHDILILYPGQAAASSVTIRYVKLLTLQTDFEASYNTASELPSEDIDVALNLAELVLLARFRQVKTSPKRLKEIIQLFQKRGILS